LQCERLYGDSGPGYEGDPETPFGFDVEHSFTPQEASKLLSDIKPKIKELMERKKMMVSLKAEIDRYQLLGIETQESRQKAATLDAMVEGMTKRIAELEDFGAMIKDLDFGIVDFPADRYGEKVLLCWKYGEPEVSYWHLAYENFSVRRPLRIQLVSP
jgi:hypothetical protein